MNLTPFKVLWIVALMLATSYIVTILLGQNTFVSLLVGMFIVLSVEGVSMVFNRPTTQKRKRKSKRKNDWDIDWD